MSKKHHGGEAAAPGLKLGRKARAFNPGVPHLSMFLAAKPKMQPPPSVDWTQAFDNRPLGMMLNDTLGDCTCAGLGHALQTWTVNASAGAMMLTITDQQVEQLYEGACGFDPNNPNGTDNGGVEQDVLSYAMNTGIPTDAGPHKINGYIEVDPRNFRDVRLTIDQFGLAYIGFNVPNSLMENGPPPVWNYDPSADNTIVGGHCVILVGYDAVGATLISWGQFYRMRWPFFGQFVDETYAMVDVDWIKSTGQAPCGLTLDELEAAMKWL